MPQGGVILALGSIAHKSVVAALGLRQKDMPFGHAAEHELPDGRVLLDSYHCSRYNTQTRRLTPAMFDAVFSRARALIDR
jgi:uracil-DNA glycosylase